MGLPPLTELQPSTPNHIYLRLTRLGFQMKKILEKIKVGLNPQESFTQMKKIEM